MPTLEELRSRPAAALPKATRTVTLIEGQHLLDVSQRLAEERMDLLMQAARTDETGEAVKQPRKAGESDLPPRVAAIDAEMVALGAQLPDHQGEVGLSGMLPGAWLRYREDHPPRENNELDLRLARGLVNASELFADLGTFVSEWDGEALKPDDWSSWLADRIIYADLRDLVTEVVDMHERSLPRAPKSPSVSSETPSGANDSDSPST
jgi:hypothetical protein